MTNQNIEFVGPQTEPIYNAPIPKAGISNGLKLVIGFLIFITLGLLGTVIILAMSLNGVAKNESTTPTPTITITPKLTDTPRTTPTDEAIPSYTPTSIPTPTTKSTSKPTNKITVTSIPLPSETPVFEGDAKPVIYLYPQKTQLINVKLQYLGNFTVTYPKYENGWNIIAKSNGDLLNMSDLKQYSYLFWEGIDNGANYDLSTGFVVKGNDSAIFLQEKLSQFGLTPKEYNEFIVYWLPKMINNKYNLVHFATKEEYNDRAVLNISPKPDTLLRVFMVMKPIEKEISVKPQTINSIERKGFTVVEWGGRELSK